MSLHLNVTLRLEKYEVVGATTGYYISCGGTRVYLHSTSQHSDGRLKGTGDHAPATNAQRGVLWLKNQGLVREAAVPVAVTPSL